MHEFVLSGRPMKKELGLATLDLAKRLLDFGFHPPTVYFPLLVDEALMVEPTETETKESLDAFADAIEEILTEAETDPGAGQERALLDPGAPAGRGAGDAQAGGAAGDGRDGGDGDAAEAEPRPPRTARRRDRLQRRHLAGRLRRLGDG